MIFEWDKLREELDRKSPTRDATIARAFAQYVEGNDAFEERSSPEMEEAFSIFRAAWLISENFSQGVKKHCKKDAPQWARYGYPVQSKKTARISQSS